MPDSLTTPSVGTEPVTATMSWKTAGSVPDVTLSFEGLDQPIALLSDLGALGWNVPVPPSRPSSAIEWTPDPVAGTEYTIRPWRVRQFKLERSVWSDEVAAALGARTYQTLVSHGVQVSGTQQMVEALASHFGVAPAQSAQVAQPNAGASAQVANQPAPAPAAVPVGGAPQVIAISYSGDALPGLRHLEGTTGGRKRSIVGWTESPHSLQDLFPDEQGRSTLLANADQAWTVQYSETPPLPSGAGQSALCAVIPGMKVDDSKLQKFVSMLGGKVVLAGLAPLDQRSSDSDALILGVVGSSNAELISSNVRLRFKKAIVRIEES